MRQHFVHFLTGHKGYPPSLLANEVELRIGDKRLRCDSVLYNTAAQPVMLIEYKAPIVSNGLQHYCCRMDYENHTYTFLRDIPHYSEL